VAADAVWFNSAFHRDAFLTALPDWLRRMPDHAPLAAVEQVRARSAVHPPGIDPSPPRPARAPGPLRILWAARWEHDKGPDDLLAALDLLAARGVDFRLAVIGERFAEAPPAFAEIERRFAGRIDHWGYQEGRAAYHACLARIAHHATATPAQPPTSPGRVLVRGRSRIPSATQARWACRACGADRRCNRLLPRASQDLRPFARPRDDPW
jgi:glycosyltransferase involved in cell wall biosynthesis